ncbi:hypothetical protein BDR05DRAFT_996353 [Suillus weaverae]|nr:hypothetical protein BDR05DRAFT_996353 [Suillus weaverae]
MWASFELDRMLGNGEVIGTLEMLWDGLLHLLSFPRVRGVRSSLTLKATVLHTCDNQDAVLFDSMGDCEISRDTDAGHARLAEHVTRILNWVSYLNDAVQHFQLVLDQCYIRNDHQDIDSIITLFRKALALRPQGHPDHPLSIYHLTKALTWSKEHTAVYVQEAAQLYYKLLPLCPQGTYLRSIAAGPAGVNYVIRQCNNLPTDTSSEGVRFRRIVLELCPLSNEHRRVALHHLAWALTSRFEQCGSIHDLDECIQYHREVVSLCSEGYSRRASYLDYLAISLYLRFNHQGSSDDLNEAITLYEEVLRLHPFGYKYRDSSLNNLGIALEVRFYQRGDVNDIIRAISLLREALTLFSPGNTSRDNMLNNLAGALHTRYGKLDASEDLDEAINLSRDSLQLTPHGHPRRHRVLCRLSSALCSRFMQTRENEDVEEAIRLCQELLDALLSLHPDRYYSYKRLQQAYLSRYNWHHNIPLKDLRNTSLTWAIDWARQAEVYRHDSALEAYQMCLELFEHHVMTRFHGARLQPLFAAVELVEHGRGQQWSLASRLRTPLEDLKLASPRLSEINKHLSDAQGSAGSTDRAAADQAAIQYRRLQEQWDAVVAEIRNHQGFSRFLLPPSYEDLQAAARHGPVIIFIASEYSCSAIVVPTSGEPRPVCFPHITLTHLEMLKKDFAREIRLASFMRPEETRNELQVLLRTVWDEIMLPIVIVLQRDLRVKGRSRIWLCPTAAFTSIPLHAAHPFRMQADELEWELCLEDVYICSYTPMLAALIRSRQMMKTRVTPSFAAIGQSEPGAGQGEALLTIDSELELVCKLVPTTTNIVTLSSDKATRAGALDALQRNTWVHLACHGKQDREQPYNSRFAMRDKPLTLLDIMERDIPHAEFAFLSACHPAVGDEKTPDEVIHLAAGLQFSGFKSVIGTLWVVDDAVAQHVVKAFYENMFKDGVVDCTKAAWALNRATCSVKTKVPLEQRIVFIHIGV